MYGISALCVHERPERACLEFVDGPVVHLSRAIIDNLNRQRAVQRVSQHLQDHLSMVTLTPSADTTFTSPDTLENSLAGIQTSDSLLTAPGACLAGTAKM